jgi:2-polyprenyl-6-methoxyphenol hydroxylase-like FAD-dependent oxidoreductase
MPLNEDQKAIWLAIAKSDRQTQQDLLRKEFADAGWQAQRLLNTMGEAPDFYFQVIQQIKMSKWFNGRVICLGDAAYAPTPLSGMGASLAITGAYVLAGELSKLQDGEHPSKAFEAYENSFRPFVEQTQDIPFVVPGIAHPATAWTRYLWHAFIWAVSKIFAMPMIAKRFGESGDDDDFPLPNYAELDLKTPN